MNSKIVLFLLLIFLILLMLFYYLKIQSNIIVLLCVIIILLLNDLIVNKEHFQNQASTQNLDLLLDRVDNTLTNLEKLKNSTEEKENEMDIPFLEVHSSCAPNYNIVDDDAVEDLSTNPLQNNNIQGIKVPNLDKDGLPLSVESSELLSGIN